MSRLQVLVIEDSPSTALLFRELLTEGCYHGVRFAPLMTTTLAAAERALEAFRFDLVLADLGLPDAAGLDVVKALVASHPDVPLVVVTGSADLGPEALAEGAEDFIVKSERNMADALPQRLVWAYRRHRRLYIRPETIEQLAEISRRAERLCHAH